MITDTMDERKLDNDDLAILEDSIQLWLNLKSDAKQTIAGMKRTDSFSEMLSSHSNKKRDYRRKSIVPSRSCDSFLNLVEIDGCNPNDDILLYKRVLKEALDAFEISNSILLKMLPEYVVKNIIKNERIVPEVIDSVTVFMSDIVGFTEIASKVEPLKVAKLLNELYIVMDYCATYFPLIKVETVGDAYMIVISCTIFIITNNCCYNHYNFNHNK